MQNPNPHAVLLASPGMGHFIPAVELGKHLATHHGFDVTIFVVAADASMTESPLFKPPQTPNPLNLVLLPLVDVSAHVNSITLSATAGTVQGGRRNKRKRKRKRKIKKF